ncbi:MAG: PP2C family protein-serine/threonine phosphatase [Nostocoides sp.]
MAPPEAPDVLDEPSPISRPTRPLLTDIAETAPERRCAQCGGVVGQDDYCTVCGTKARPLRDHIEQSPAAWVAGVCDRGLVHSRNEDALATWAQSQPSTRAVLVVCDGVTTAEDSDVAAAAAAAAALQVLQPPPPHGVGGPDAADAIARHTLAAAAAAANTAVIAHTDPSSEHPASCTLAMAVIQDGTLWAGVIGDSRVYLLPDGEPGQVLLGDDSVAQSLIDAGTDRASAENSAQAHAITKWLGLDSPDTTPRVASSSLASTGWVLVCSDGLWNYASTPDQLRAQLDAAADGMAADDGAADDPLAVAGALVEWANSQGGRDNITVALARVGTRSGESSERV